MKKETIVRNKRNKKNWYEIETKKAFIKERGEKKITKKENKTICSKRAMTRKKKRQERAQEIETRSCFSRKKRQETRAGQSVVSEIQELTRKY